LFVNNVVGDDYDNFDDAVYFGKDDDDDSTIEEFDEDDIITHQNIDDMTLSPNNVDAIIEGEKEFTCMDDIDSNDENNVENDDLEYIYMPTFKEHDNMRMKIISFPQLKNLIECSLSCQQCTLLQQKSILTVSQKTFKRATLIYVKCNKGHKFYITPERVDNANTQHYQF